MINAAGGATGKLVRGLNAIAFGVALLFSASTLTTTARAHTDDELRALYYARDIGGMERIAETGDVRAEAWMGLMLQNRGNRAASKKWWARAAAKGNRFAIGSLVRMHEDDRELDQAIRWLRHGAEIGDPSSQTDYAYALAAGRGVPRNSEEAFFWYSAAAKQHHSEAYLPLAELYSEGRGTSRDPVTALALADAALRKADSSDTKTERESKALIAKLHPELSREQQRQAEAIAKAYR